MSAPGPATEAAARLTYYLAGGDVCTCDAARTEAPKAQLALRGLPECVHDRSFLRQLTSGAVEPILRAVRERASGQPPNASAEIAAPMVKSELWRSVGEALSRWAAARFLLSGIFDMEDEDSISEFLKVHECVFGALVEFVTAVRKINVAAGRPRLRVVVHHDDVDEQELQILVPLNLDVASAAAVMEDLESDWWMNLSADVRKLVGADALYT